MKNFDFLFYLGKLADETALTKNLDNRTFLIDKGIWQYLQYIKPEELVTNRLLTGNFLKKFIFIYVKISLFNYLFI